MGWDAQATRNGEPLAISPDYWSIEDLPFRSAFESAHRQFYEACGWSCTYFQGGQLSGSRQKEMFERALQLRFRDIAGGVLEWSPQEVRKMYEKADWTFDFDPQDSPHYWLCRLFLKTCAEQGLGVHMSW